MAGKFELCFLAKILDICGEIEETTFQHCTFRVKYCMPCLDIKVTKVIGGLVQEEQGESVWIGRPFLGTVFKKRFLERSFFLHTNYCRSCSSFSNFAL